jgi:hypothetical protein
MYKLVANIAAILVMLDIAFLFINYRKLPTFVLFFCLFLLVFFFIIAFFSSKFHKSKTLTKLIEQKEGIVSFEDLNQYPDNSVKNLSKAQFEEELKNYNSKITLGIIFCFSIFLSFLVFPVILFPIGIWMIINARKDISSLRSYFLLNSGISEISNTQIISKEIFTRIQVILILKKIFLENTFYFDLEIIDFCIFDYKNK